MARSARSEISSRCTLLACSINHHEALNHRQAFHLRTSLPRARCLTLTLAPFSPSRRAATLGIRTSRSAALSLPARATLSHHIRTFLVQSNLPRRSKVLARAGQASRETSSLSLLAWIRTGASRPTTQPTPRLHSADTCAAVGSPASESALLCAKHRPCSARARRLTREFATAPLQSFQPCIPQEKRLLHA